MNIIQDTRYGKMIFNDRDIYQGKSFINYGEYSEGEVKLFRQLVKAGDVVVEVGANIGSHTIPLAQIVGKDGLVLAIEPECNNFYALCGNVAINNLTNVRCWQVAISDSKGKMEIPVIDPDHTDNFGAIELELDYTKFLTYNVDRLTLDHVMIDKCRLLKVDVEGMEEKVIRGGEGFINEFRPFLYVENDRPEKSNALMNTIHRLGYKMYFHCPYMFNPENHFGNTSNVMGNVASINMLCVPNELPFNPNLEPVSVSEQ